MPSCSDQYLDSHGIQPTAQQSFGYSMIVTYLTDRLLFRPSQNLSLAISIQPRLFHSYILLSNKYLHCSHQFSNAFGQLLSI